MEQSNHTKEILEMLSKIRPEFDFGESGNYIEDGMLDSFDVITLTSMLEEKYNIRIDGMDIVPENFATVDAILGLVGKSGGKS